MTDSHQQSYYELALTNRQVMVAFVVLLVCIFVAFFSGIWIGRKDEPALLANEPGQTTEAAAEDLDLGTLEFFSDSDGTPAEKPKRSRESAGKKSQETTLLEDVTQKRATSPAEVAPAPVPAQPEPTVAEVRQEPQEEPVSTPTQAEVPTGDMLVIQVFSSSDAVQAGNLKDRLVGAGYSAFISSVDVGGRTMHRVRVGPFKERTEASSIADRVRQEFKLDTWITR